MAHGKEARAEVRSNYVQGRPLTTAAEVAGVSYQTARNWKREACGSGDDWDTAKQARILASSGPENVGSQLLEELVTQFIATINDLRTKDLAPETKANVLASLADSYLKTVMATNRATAGQDDLSQVMLVLQRLTKFTHRTFPQHLAIVMEVVEAFGEHVAGEQ